MSKELQIVFVEDKPADAALVTHELRRAGLAFRLKRVDTKEAFAEELTLREPDVILSDHGLAAFDGYTALVMAREKCPDVPFIFVTGGMGEGSTIEAFEQGAKDCILKTQLSKLGPAVRRRLGETENKFKHLIAEADRERLIAELQEHLLAKRRDFTVHICSSCRKIRDSENHWQSVEEYLRDHVDVSVTRSVCPECAGRIGSAATSSPGGVPAG